MTTIQDSKQLRTMLITTILRCINGNTPKEHLVDLVHRLTDHKNVTRDIPLLKSIALLEFLANQVERGNNDILTKKLMQEGYVYVLNTLTQ